jgi:hypothetical protein
MGYGLDIGFVDHLSTQLIPTLNYSAVDKLHALQITTPPVKPYSSLLVSSTAIRWQRLLSVEILQLPALMSLLSSKYPTTEILSTGTQQ